MQNGVPLIRLPSCLLPVPQDVDQLTKMKNRTGKRGRGQPGNRRRTFSEPTLQRSVAVPNPIVPFCVESQSKLSVLLPWLRSH